MAQRTYSQETVSRKLRVMRKLFRAADSHFETHAESNEDIARLMEVGDGTVRKWRTRVQENSHKDPGGSLIHGHFESYVEELVSRYRKPEPGEVHLDETHTEAFKAIVMSLPRVDRVSILMDLLVDLVKEDD